MTGLFDRWYGVSVGPISLRDQSREIGGYVEPVTLTSGNFDVPYVFWLTWCQKETQKAPKVDKLANSSRRESLLECYLWFDRVREYDHSH